MIKKLRKNRIVLVTRLDPPQMLVSRSGVASGSAEAEAGMLERERGQFRPPTPLPQEQLSMKTGNRKRGWKTGQPIGGTLSTKQVSSLANFSGIFPLSLKQAFFHRFCDNKHNRFSENLSLGEKSLSLGKNPFIFMGEI